MISQAELSRIQRDVQAIALSLPCVIQRKNTVRDQFLTATDTWVTVSPTGLKCGMSEPTGTMLQNFDYLVGSLAAWKVILPYGTNVLPQDRLIVTGEFTEQELTVQVVLEPRSYASLLTILASEIK